MRGCAAQIPQTLTARAVRGADGAAAPLQRMAAPRGAPGALGPYLAPARDVLEDEDPQSALPAR
jgi:hypothetical protein